MFHCLPMAFQFGRPQLWPQRSFEVTEVKNVNFPEFSNSNYLTMFQSFPLAFQFGYPQFWPQRLFEVTEVINVNFTDCKIWGHKRPLRSKMLNFQLLESVFVSGYLRSLRCLRSKLSNVNSIHFSTSVKLCFKGQNKGPKPFRSFQMSSNGRNKASSLLEIFNSLQIGGKKVPS